MKYVQTKQQIYVKSICSLYFVNRFCIQNSGFHFLIAILNFSVISNPLIYVGITSQILRLRYLTLSEPWLKVLTFGTPKQSNFKDYTGFDALVWIFH